MKRVLYLMSFGLFFSGLRAQSALEGAQDEEPRLVRGKLTLVSDDGTRRAPREGEILLTIQCGGTVCERKVSVAEGEWVYELGRADRFFGVACMQLEGRPAFRSDDPGGTWPAEPGEVALEAKWLPAVRLVVTDREGLPLEEVQYVPGRADFWRHVALGHYTSLGVEWSQPTVSPIALDLTACEASVFMAPGLDPWAMRPICVRAENHALTEVTVDPKIGGDVRVVLAPTTTLELTIHREDDMQRALSVDLMPRFATAGMLSLRDLPGSAVSSKRIYGLEPGPWSAWLSWLRPVTKNSSRIEYAKRVFFELVEGETRYVELRIADPDADKPAGVPLVGELTLPVSWDTDVRQVEVVLSRLQSGSSRFEAEQCIAPGSLETTVSAGTWRFDAGLVQPGHWLAHVVPFGSLQRFEVPSAGAHVALAVPEPVDVALTIAGSDSDFVSWRPVITSADSTLQGGAALETVRASDDGLFRFRGALGSIEVLPSRASPELLELVAGTSEYELTLPVRSQR